MAITSADQRIFSARVLDIRRDEFLDFAPADRRAMMQLWLIQSRLIQSRLIEPWVCPTHALA
jgi:hypothetical protein